MFAWLTVYIPKLLRSLVGLNIVTMPFATRPYMKKFGTPSLVGMREQVAFSFDLSKSINIIDARIVLVLNLI